MGRPTRGSQKLQKLNLKSGTLKNLNLDFKVTLTDSGSEFDLEDRDLLNLLQRKLGISPKTPIEEADRETFTGEFDFSKYHDKFYADYESTAVVNLSASSETEMGSVCTVRIQGDKTGTVPSGWNQSGDTLSTASGEWNEITVMYVTSDDIRMVNRVFTK